MNNVITIRRIFLTIALLYLRDSVGQENHAYLGCLHSHTSYSDGSGFPDEAYAHARDVAHCDFFAVTEHNHNVDIHPKEPRQGQAPIGGNHALYGVFGETPTPGQAHPTLIAAANAATVDGSFVAIYGQEFSSISSGNHVCVFDVPEVITAPNGAFDELVAWLRDPHHFDSSGGPANIQFNHPSSELRANNTEYGMDDFGGQANWIKEMGALARTIEVLNGPGTDPGAHHALPPSAESAFEIYLSLGFHLAPSADQDNHFRTWGDFTTARTGIIATRLSKAALLEAIRARHVYATTDSNLRVIAKINGVLAGEIAELSAPDSPLRIEVKITDDDEPHAAYKIDVISGFSGDAKMPQKKDTFTGTGDGTFSFDEFHFEGAKQYVFLKIHQMNEDGVEDVAWTAPVWFESGGSAGGGGPTVDPTAPVFIASKRSAVFHTNPNCPQCKSIKPENRITGEQARNGRTPHNCPPQ